LRFLVKLFTLLFFAVNENTRWDANAPMIAASP
jgi:hypothetical protein